MDLETIKYNLDNNIGNYYDNVVLYIKLLIDDDQKDKAFEVLKDEISQPYVPTKTMEELEDIFENVFVQEVLTKQVSIEEVRESLLSLKIDNIVHSIYTVNLRELSDEITFYLKNSDDYVSMSILVYTLIDQQVSIELNISKFGYNKSINPVGMQIVDEELIKKYDDLFTNYFEKEPVYVKYCMDILRYYLLVTYPFNLDRDFDLFDSIIIYVNNIVNEEKKEISEQFLEIVEYDKGEKNE